MKVLLAIATFVLGIAAGVGVQTFQFRGVGEIIHTAMACSAMKVATTKGIVAAGDRDRTIDAIAAAPGADAQLKTTMKGLKSYPDKAC
jgi:hypothetical protein